MSNNYIICYKDLVNDFFTFNKYSHVNITLHSVTDFVSVAGILKGISAIETS